MAKKLKLKLKGVERSTPKGPELPVKVSEEGFHGLLKKAGVVLATPGNRWNVRKTPLGEHPAYKQGQWYGSHTSGSEEQARKSFAGAKHPKFHTQLLHNDKVVEEHNAPNSQHAEEKKMKKRTFDHLPVSVRHRANFHQNEAARHQSQIDVYNRNIESGKLKPHQVKATRATIVPHVKKRDEHLEKLDALLQQHEYGDGPSSQHTEEKKKKMRPIKVRDPYMPDTPAAAHAYVKKHGMNDLMKMHSRQHLKRILKMAGEHAEVVMPRKSLLISEEAMKKHKELSGDQYSESRVLKARRDRLHQVLRSAGWRHHAGKYGQGVTSFLHPATGHVAHVKASGGWEVHDRGGKKIASGDGAQTLQKHLSADQFAEEYESPHQHIGDMIHAGKISRMADQVKSHDELEHKLSQGYHLYRMRVGTASGIAAVVHKKGDDKLTRVHPRVAFSPKYDDRHHHLGFVPGWGYKEGGSQHAEDSLARPDASFDASFTPPSHQKPGDGSRAEQESIEWDTLEPAQRNRVLDTCAATCTPEHEKMGMQARFEKEHGTGNPPSFAVDESKWEAAKKAVGRGKYGGENDSHHWAVVTHVYEKMGGKIRGHTSQHAEDDYVEMPHARYEPQEGHRVRVKKGMQHGGKYGTILEEPAKGYAIVAGKSGKRYGYYHHSDLLYHKDDLSMDTQHEEDERAPRLPKVPRSTKPLTPGIVPPGGRGLGPNPAAKVKGAKPSSLGNKRGRRDEPDLG